MQGGSLAVQYPPSCRKVVLGELKEEGGIFYLRGKRISHIDIIGTVLSILHKSKRTVMEVDDNTAVIHCVTFDNDNTQAGMETDSTARDEDGAIPEGLARGVWDDGKPETSKEFFRRLVRRRRRPVRHGDLVNVTGRLTVFYNRWQIITSSVVRVDDCNAEWFRIREIEAQRKALKE